MSFPNMSEQYQCNNHNAKIHSKKLVEKRFFRKKFISFYLRMVFVGKRLPLPLPMLPMLRMLPVLPSQLSLTMDWWLTELKVYLQNRTFQYFHFPYRQKRKRGKINSFFWKKKRKKKKNIDLPSSEWLSSLTWILNIDESGTIHPRVSFRRLGGFLLLFFHSFFLFLLALFVHLSLLCLIRLVLQFILSFYSSWLPLSFLSCSVSYPASFFLFLLFFLSLVQWQMKLNLHFSRSKEVLIFDEKSVGSAKSTSDISFKATKTSQIFIFLLQPITIKYNRMTKFGVWSYFNSSESHQHFTATAQ